MSEGSGHLSSPVPRPGEGSKLGSRVRVGLGEVGRGWTIPRGASLRRGPLGAKTARENMRQKRASNKKLFNTGQRPATSRTLPRPQGCLYRKPYRSCPVDCHRNLISNFHGAGGGAPKPQKSTIPMHKQHKCSVICHQEGPWQEP